MQAVTDTAVEKGTSLMQIAQDILSDVKEAAADEQLLDYAANRAMRRLRVALGSKNPDTAILKGLAERARITDVRELGALLDETQLVAVGG